MQLSIDAAKKIFALHAIPVLMEVTVKFALDWLEKVVLRDRHSSVLSAFICSQIFASGVKERLGIVGLRVFLSGQCYIKTKDKKIKIFIQTILLPLDELDIC